jgi:hypothetical protein
MTPEEAARAGDEQNAKAMAAAAARRAQKSRSGN